LSISRSAPDFFGVYLALGGTLVVGLPAFFNMCVVTGLIPNKGLPLPFFSYGGSNLLICFTAMGLLLNVAAQSRDAKKAPAPKRRLALRAPRLVRVDA
jgi:cell division protein FtsW